MLKMLVKIDVDVAELNVDVLLLHIDQVITSTDLLYCQQLESTEMTINKWQNKIQCNL